MLTQGLPFVAGDPLTGLEGLGGGSALLHRAQPGLDPLGELLAALAPDPFDQFLHTTVRPDAEADGALCHPGSRGKVGGC